jgi:hypothetical protein
MRLAVLGLGRLALAIILAAPATTRPGRALWGSQLLMELPRRPGP